MASSADSSQPATEREGRVHYFLTLALLTVIYYLSARIGLFLEVQYGEVTPIWPPSGIALAVFLINGRKFWPMILIGEFFVALTLQQSYAIGLIGGLAQLAEALLAWQLLSSLKVGNITASERNLLLFCLAGVLVPPVFSALLGSFALHSYGYLDSGDLASALFTWWLGDALGILVLTPFLTALARRPRGLAARMFSFALIIFFTAVFCLLLVLLGEGRSYYLFFMLLPFVVIAALHFGAVGAGSTILLLTATVFCLRLEDLGQQDFLTAVRLAFVGTCAFTGYLVAGLATKRKTYTDLISRQHRTMSTLHDVALALMVQRNTTGLLDTIIANACTTLDVEDGVYCRWRDGRKEFQVVAGCGVYSEIHDDIELPGEEMLKQVWLQDAPLLVNSRQPGSGRHADASGKSPEAFIGTPVRRGDNTDGVLAVSSWKKQRLFDADDMAALHMFADLAAIALQNASAYAEVNHQLQRRIRAEKALAASEQSHRQILDATSDAILVLEKESGGILQMNRSARRYADAASAGAAPDFFRLFFKTKATAAEQEAHTRFHRCHEYGQQLLEFIYTTGDGEKIWLEAVFKKALISDQIRVLAVIRNIDLHKRAEAELRQLQTAIEFAAEDVMVTDVNGRIRYVNPAFERITGYRQEEVVGKKPSILKSGLQKESVYKELWATISQGKLWSGRLYNRCKDGSLVCQEANIAPIGDDDNAVSGYVSIKRDITEEEKIREKLFQAQKMEALGTLAGGIAHDFNNILFGILGRVSLMASDPSLSPPHLEHMRAIEEYIQSATSLTKQLLGVGRGGKYDPRPVDLTTLVSESVAAFGRTRKEIDIALASSSSPVTANVDRQQIEQVLLNIYVNAWQAMPDGGKIGLRIDTTVHDGSDAAADDIPPGRYCRIRIEDSGIGMDEVTLKKIFDPFFTTKEKGRGTGLGLASAYGIIRRHGGSILASSSPGKGTVFTILLPASSEKATETPVPQQSIATGSETVLLVDDEAMIRDVGKALLESLGYTVITAESGQQALSLFQNHNTDIDLVLLDLIMPGMNGATVFKKLRSLQPDIPILLSSGYAKDGVAENLLQQGGCGFIQKPFSMAEFSLALRSILDEDL